MSSQKKLGSTLFWFKILTGRFHSVLYLIPFLIIIFLLYKYIAINYMHLMPSLMVCLSHAIVAFVLTLIIVPIIIKVARKLNYVSIPEYPKDRFLAVPLLGGLAIYLAFLLTAFLYPLDSKTISIIVASGLVLILGTIDDKYPLSSIIRLVGQITASLIVISSGLIVSFMPNTVFGNIIATLITIFWILGIVNATNFVDGVDGLAAGFSGIVCFFFFLITLHLEQYGVTLISAITMGACFGFLVFNFKPAKIYLGDGGSTLLGFLLACYALYGGWSDKGPIIALGIPVIILGVLIFDMIYITISRIKNGNVRSVREWLDYRGRDHFHHRLINLGFKEHHAVIFIYIISIVLGLAGLVLENATMSYPVILLFVQAILIFVTIIMLMLVGRKLSD